MDIKNLILKNEVYLSDIARKKIHNNGKQDSKTLNIIGEKVQEQNIFSKSFAITRHIYPCFVSSCFVQLSFIHTIIQCLHFTNILFSYKSINVCTATATRKRNVKL